LRTIPIKHSARRRIAFSDFGVKKKGRCVRGPEVEVWGRPRKGILRRKTTMPGSFACGTQNRLGSANGYLPRNSVQSGHCKNPEAFAGIGGDFIAIWPPNPNDRPACFRSGFWCLPRSDQRPYHRHFCWFGYDCTGRSRRWFPPRLGPLNCGPFLSDDSRNRGNRRTR
jgi:hypothetical protein